MLFEEESLYELSLCKNTFRGGGLVLWRGGGKGRENEKERMQSLLLSKPMVSWKTVNLRRRIEQQEEYVGKVNSAGFRFLTISTTRVFLCTKTAICVRNQHTFDVPVACAKRKTNHPLEIPRG